MKKKNLFKTFGIIGAAIGLSTIVTITGCGPKEEEHIEPTTTVNVTAEDFLQKLTTNEALVETKAMDVTEDTKEITKEDGATVVATAHVVTEYFTDGTYVAHKTYKAENVAESETQVIAYKPKVENIVRLADGLHKIVEKPAEEIKEEAVKENTTTENTEVTTTPVETTTTVISASEGKFDTDKVIVEKDTIPETDIEYEEIVFEKDKFDEAIKDNAKREDTFVEGNSDTVERQETVVKNKTEEISKTIEEKPTQQVQTETLTESTAENKETETSEANNNTANNNNAVNNNSTNTNSNSANNNSSSNKNNNSSNNNSNKNNNSSTPKQTEAPKQTQHTHNWVAQYKTENYTEQEPYTETKQIPGAQVYDTCSYEIVKTIYSDNAYSEARQYVLDNMSSWLKSDSKHCVFGYRDISPKTETVTKYRTVTKTRQVANGYKCSSCGATK